MAEAVYVDRYPNVPASAAQQAEYGMGVSNKNLAETIKTNIQPR